MTEDQVLIIERLRAAAREHGEVSDLLSCIAASLYGVADGDSEFHGEGEDAAYIEAAISAAAFVAYDRRTKVKN